MSRPAIEFEVLEIDAGLRLASFLQKCGVSLSVIRGLKYLEDGLLVNGQRAQTNRCLLPGDRVSLLQQPEPTFSARPEDVPLALVYQSMEALVVNKPAGMATHPDPSHHTATLANAVCGLYRRQSYGGTFRPIGRLDTDTSGLVLCAGGAASAHLLATTVKKLYLALVRGALPLKKGVIDAPLCAQPGSTTRQQVDAAGRPSRTEYHVLSSGREASLVAVLPKTGRTHQIRAHFAHLGHPLLGDELYKGPKAFLRRHALHCAGLRFLELSGNCPVLYVPPPADMQAAMWHLGLAHSGLEKMHLL